MSCPQIILAGLLGLGTSNTVQLKVLQLNCHGSYLLETIEGLGTKVIFPSICVYNTLLKRTYPLKFATFEDYFRLQKWDMYLCV